MKSINTIFLSLFFFLFINTLNADCLDSFNSENYAALQEYGADLNRCGSARLCIREANLSYSSAVGVAANNYSDCCDNGGGGCPIE